MNININIVELACELAERELEQTRAVGQINSVEDECGCIVYTDEAQDIFNDLYDEFYTMIENLSNK
jgi:uncharacterized protein YpuA (DUF1002 family)